MSSLTGEFTQNHATMKTLLAYMMMHPGKKLLFMGQDFAYTKKWSTNEPLDWRLRDKESYREVNDLVRDLNKLYSSKSALHVNDLNEDGFEWINEMDATRSIISFIRKSNNLEETLLVVCNFTPVEYEGYSVGVPYKGRYKEIFTTEDEKYGGLGSTNPRLKNARPGSIDGREFYINVTVAPMSVSVFDYTPLVSSKVNVKDEDSNVIDSNTSTNSNSKNAGGSKKTVASKSVNKSNTKRSTTSKNATKSSKNNSASKTVKQATDAISKKAKEVKDKVGKEVSSKADKVTKTVGSKANEIKKKANSAKDLVTETVTVTADDVKKAAKKVTKKTEKKVDRK